MINQEQVKDLETRVENLRKYLKIDNSLIICIKTLRKYSSLFMC